MPENRREVVDNLAQLLEVLPPHIRSEVEALEDVSELIEIVLDLGRQPEARFPARFVYLSDEFVSAEDIDYVVKRVGEFGNDNRAGIERTLHRISAIRNRKGKVIGLTCRIGRAVFGTIDIVRDVIESGKSTLLLGRPGVGKTTLLREVARVLADEFKKRVVVVDTSNEIAGDGDIPHPAIGHARRMQVPRVDLQAQVMIEAVENHMPEVVVIDEIGTEAEAQAARTIAERGVQLVGTAHGNTLDNLVLNPTLSDLVGGIQAVTLSDEEARKRGTQKTVLERKAPPTFAVVIEIQDRDRLAIHHDVATTVDLMLRGVEPAPEVRVRSETGEIQVLKGDDARRAVAAAALAAGAPAAGRRRRRTDGVLAASPGLAAGLASSLVHGPSPGIGRPYGPDLTAAWAGLAGAGAETGGWAARPGELEGPETPVPVGPARAGGREPANPWYSPRPLRIFPYAVSANRLERAVAELGAPVQVSKDLESADLVLTLKGQYRKMPKKLKEAERRGVPIEVIRSNTITQVTQFLERLRDGEGRGFALMEAEQAVARVKAEGKAVELSPQNAYLRRLQHQLIERYHLRSTSVGEEPNRRVMVIPGEVN